jgi:NADH:ubiquinone oxidoreductase subunit 5 (subunit L)/multisubunit Na+/H+ antiporter MnhA subunit
LLLHSHPVFGTLHRFFWNRWLIDAFYRRWVVGGIAHLASIVAHDLEDPLDRLVHRRLPQLFTEKTGRLLHRFRTETEELVYNMSYVLVLFVLLLALLLLGPDGG